MIWLAQRRELKEGSAESGLADALRAPVPQAYAGPE